MPHNLLKRFGEFMRSVGRGDFKSPGEFFKSSFISWLAIAALAAAAALLSTISIESIPTNMREGMIAPRNIKADRNYEIVDEEASHMLKEDATAGILPVYDFDERIADSIEKRIRGAFAYARERLKAMAPVDGARRGAKQNFANPKEVEDLSSTFASILGVTPTPQQMEALLNDRFNFQTEGALAGLVHRVMSRPVVAERGSLDAEKEKGIILRRIKQDGISGQSDENAITNVTRIISTEEARQEAKKLSASGLGSRGPDLSQAITGLAESLVEPNCSMNITETERRREEASGSVKSVILKIKAGEMIIREGSRYEPWHLKVLSGIQKERRRGIYSVEFFGMFLLVMLFMVVPFYLAERFFRRVRATRSDHVLMGIVGLFTLAIMRVSLLLAPAVHDALFTNVATSTLMYAIPIAGGAMLLRLFLGSEITFVFAVVISSISGLYIGTDIRFVAFGLVTSFAAIISIANADRRSLIVKAGALTGAAGALMYAGIKLAGLASAQDPIAATDIVWGLLFAFLSGVGSSIFTMIAAPIVESVSGYTSDIKLLELANLNHPLLRELIVRAPGTYHHSHMVGILGEAAAEAIGAKALLVRVGAYYHDIGKMKKPLYFIENAKAGESKHDKLSPHMSALIVSAHVKDGLDMAQAARIPAVIADMIPQHHGTRLIGFFYEKAKEQQNEAVQKVDQKDFVYPGPKPQNREAAILMLADATEAAVRALKEKGPTRIQQTVQRVITDIFAEKQLDECELTLKDLNEISRAFIRILLGIYHSRIEYPKEMEHDKSEISIVDDSGMPEDSSDKLPSSPSGRPGIH